MQIFPRPFVLIALTFAFLGLTACSSTQREAAIADWTPFTAEVVWNREQRGFWGLKVDGIGKVNPLSLPEAVQVNGMRIRGELRLRPDAVSMKNWGTVGEVRNVERLN